MTHSFLTRALVAGASVVTMFGAAAAASGRTSAPTHPARIAVVRSAALGGSAPTESGCSDAARSIALRQGRIHDRGQPPPAPSVA